MQSAFYLSFIPGEFERHASASFDGAALCGAVAHAQGECRPIAALRVDCEHCLRTAANPVVLGYVLDAQSEVEADGRYFDHVVVDGLRFGRCVRAVGLSRCAGPVVGDHDECRQHLDDRSARRDDGALRHREPEGSMLARARVMYGDAR